MKPVIIVALMLLTVGCVAPEGSRVAIDSNEQGMLDMSAAAVVGEFSNGSSVISVGRVGGYGTLHASFGVRLASDDYKNDLEFLFGSEYYKEEFNARMSAAWILSMNDEYGIRFVYTFVVRDYISLQQAALGIEKTF